MLKLYALHLPLFALLLSQCDTGEAYRRKLLLPEYGNHVDHDLLFSRDIETPSYSPSRLWRLSPEIYRARYGDNARSPFVYATSEREIQDYAATITEERIADIVGQFQTALADREP